MVYIYPRGGRSAQQLYPYSTLLVKRRCALKVHFNNDRCGEGVPIETYLCTHWTPSVPEGYYTSFKVYTSARSGT